MRNTVKSPKAKMVFEVAGKALADGHPVRERMVARDEDEARQIGASRGMTVETVTREGVPLTARRQQANKPDYTEGIIATVVILIFTPICVLGTLAVRWDYQRSAEKAAVADARVRAERGPEWEQAVAFAEGAIPPGRDGVGWFITRSGSGDATVRYDQVTAQYRIKVHMYPRGKNPLNASLNDRLEGGLIVRGSGESWSVVKLDPFGW